jgi:hypothetical protein
MLPLVDVPDRPAWAGLLRRRLDVQQGRISVRRIWPRLPEGHRGRAAPPEGVYDLLEAPADTLAVMSTADGWDLTVPEDAAELLAELRRHGVRPGQRLHVVATPPEPDIATEEATREPRKTRRLSFAGSIQAEPDLSQKTDEYLKGFGQG